MSAHKKNLNKTIVALFSGQSSIITIPKLYIQLTGSHSLGTVLNQSVFWADKSICNDGSFHKTYKEWFEETNIPERTLRRYFKILEAAGWIQTKVKKAKGKNTKHVRPDLDRIVESISNMLNTDCPIRPTCPNGLIEEQNSCTKVAPTGHIGRLEPATLAGSTIYTENYLHNTTTATDPNPSSSFFTPKQETELLSLRVDQDMRLEKLFLEHCKHHMVRQKGFSKSQMFSGLKNILKGHRETGEIFKARGFVDIEAEKVRNENETIRLRLLYEAQDRAHAQKYCGQEIKLPEARKGNGPRLLSDMLKGTFNANTGRMQTQAV